MRVAAAVAFSLLTLAVNGFAQTTAAADFTHAGFKPGKRSLENLIKFPRGDFSGTLAVICSARATAKGRLKDARCSSPQDPDLTFTMAVSRRFNAARLNPATIDGRAEEVDFQFTVMFSKIDGVEEIETYPNNGKNTDRLGLDYVSAQRYSPHPFPARCSGWRRDDLLLEVAIVDQNGRARETDVMSASVGIDSRCKRALLAQLDDARWIPAAKNGEFVESVWVSPIVLANLSYKRDQSEQ